MSRSYNSLRNQSARQPITKGSRQTGRTISVTGLSVFRGVRPEPLYETMRAIDSNQLVYSSRSRQEQKPHAVSLIEKKEIDLNISYLGGLVTDSLFNEMFNSIPSLRKKLELSIARLSILGHRESPIRPICLVFDENTNERLTEEREQIITIIEANVDDASYQFGTRYRHKIPHLSLCSIPIYEKVDQQNRLLAELEASLPKTLVTQPATFYSR